MEPRTGIIPNKLRCVAYCRANTILKLSLLVSVAEFRVRLRDRTVMLYFTCSSNSTSWFPIPILDTKRPTDASAATLFEYDLMDDIHIHRAVSEFEQRHEVLQQHGQNATPHLFRNHDARSSCLVVLALVGDAILTFRWIESNQRGASTYIECFCCTNQCSVRRCTPYERTGYTGKSWPDHIVTTRTLLSEKGPQDVPGASRCHDVRHWDMAKEQFVGARATPLYITCTQNEARIKMLYLRSTICRSK